MIAAREFSVGVLRGWHGIVLGLVAAAIFLVSGREELSPPPSWGAAFSFFLALFSTGGVIYLGIGAQIWSGAVLGAASFGLEVWLIWRWWRKAYSM